MCGEDSCLKVSDKIFAEYDELVSSISKEKWSQTSEEESFIDSSTETLGKTLQENLIPVLASATVISSVWKCTRFPSTLAQPLTTKVTRSRHIVPPSIKSPSFDFAPLLINPELCSLLRFDRRLQKDWFGSPSKLGLPTSCRSRIENNNMNKRTELKHFPTRRVSKPAPKRKHNSEISANKRGSYNRKSSLILCLHLNSKNKRSIPLDRHSLSPKRNFLLKKKKYLHFVKKSSPHIKRLSTQKFDEKILTERSHGKNAVDFTFCETRDIVKMSLSPSTSKNTPKEVKMPEDSSDSHNRVEGFDKKDASELPLQEISVQQTFEGKQKNRVFNFDTQTVSTYHQSSRHKYTPSPNSLRPGSSSTIRLIDKILADPQHFDKKTIDKKFEKRFKKGKQDDGYRIAKPKPSSYKETAHSSQVDKKSRKQKTKHRSKASPFSTSSNSSDSCSSPVQTNSRHLPQYSKHAKPRLKTRSRSLDTFTSPVNPLEANRRDAFRAEVIGTRQHSNPKPNCVNNFPNKGKTRAILNRLDSVLSDLVEKEKRRIQYLEVSNARLRDRSLDSQPRLRATALEVTNLKRPRSSQSNNKQKSFSRRPTPADVMEQHKEWFTELKPHRPRILKSEIKAKLLSYRCYQKPKRLKASTTNTDPSETTLEDSSMSSQQPVATSMEEIEEDIVTDSNNNANNEEEPNPSGSIRKPNDDDDDTCYGSDMVQSDSMPDKVPDQMVLPPKYETSNDGEFSIDSAYNGSREATPDIQKNTLKKTGGIRTTITQKESFCPSSPVFGNSPSKRIEQGRSFILEKIKNMRFYSDQDINMLLSEYQIKWDHVPERELSIITKSIRRDLGVPAPPKECVSQLLSNASFSNKGLEHILSKPSFSLSSSSSKRECIQALTRTLPFHPMRREKTPTENTTDNSHNEGKTQNDTPSHIEETIRTCKLPAKPENLWEASDPEISQEIEDENWAKSVLGNDSYILEEARKALEDPSDKTSNWNSLTEELCSKFDLQL